MVSDVVASVTMSGAPVEANRPPTMAAACGVVGAHHETVGVQAVTHRVPSRKNSGLETTRMSERPMTCSTKVAEPTGTVDLLTTMAPVLEQGRHLLGRRLDVGEVGRAVVALGGGHAQEDELGPGDGLGGRGGEVQMAGGDPSATSSSRPDLDDGHPAAAQRGEARRVALGQHHPMAEVGQRGRGGEADVAGADHRHGAGLPDRGPLVLVALVRAVTPAASFGVQGLDQPDQSVVPVRQGRQSAEAQRHVVEHRVGRAGRGDGAGRARRWRSAAPARDRRRRRPGWPARNPTRSWPRCWSRGRCPGACPSPG